MKTNAIRECIDYLGPDSGCVAAKNAVAELKSLELALAEAEKREAVKDENFRLRNLIAAREFNTAEANRELQCGDGWLCDHGQRDRELADEIEALSTTQTDKALVSVEQLSIICRVLNMQASLLSYWHSCGETTCEESISAAYRQVRIDKDRLIKWANAKLKEVGDGS